jgi:membrane protein YdbS with pleckstrin-like domain
METLPSLSTVDEEESLKQLDPNAIPAWRITAAAKALVVVVVGVVGLTALSKAEVATTAVLVLLFLVVLVVVLGAAWYLPLIEWRQWRYAIRDDEIELRSGIFTVTRTLIPMSRVQLVDFRQGLIDREFDLATITIHTAAGQREIPGIAAREAEPLRSRIAALANIHDDL